MNKHLLILLTCAALGTTAIVTVYAQDESEAHKEDHDHEKSSHSEEGEHSDGDEHAHSTEEKKNGHDESGQKEDDDHGHDEEAEHGDHEESGHGENKAVGPEKGITEANEKLGFKLSAEAIKNFGLTTQDVTGPGTFTLKRSSIFFGLQERNIYRLRDGFYRRIDFVTISKSFSQLTISVSDLRPGDKIVLSGLGFLRIAEIAAFGGIGEGHAH